MSGAGFSLAASNLSSGWNLCATADHLTPAAFSAAVGNVTTLWAWDNPSGAWYFFSPTMVANNTMADYIHMPLAASFPDVQALAQFSLAEVAPFRLALKICQDRCTIIRKDLLTHPFYERAEKIFQENRSIASGLTIQSANGQS